MHVDPRAAGCLAHRRGSITQSSGAREKSRVDTATGVLFLGKRTSRRCYDSYRTDGTESLPIVLPAPAGCYSRATLTMSYFFLFLTKARVFIGNQKTNVLKSPDYILMTFKSL